MHFIFVFLQPVQRALVLARVHLSTRACESVKGNKGRYSLYLASRNARATQTQQRDTTHKSKYTKYVFIALFLSNNSSLHMSKSQHSRNAHGHTNPHAQGSRDSAAVLITPNGSIRHSVMINPVESLPLLSVTCREAAPPPLALSALTDRWSIGATVALVPAGPAQGHLNEASVLIFSLDGPRLLSSVK